MCARGREFLSGAVWAQVQSDAECSPTDEDASQPQQSCACGVFHSFFNDVHPAQVNALFAATQKMNGAPGTGGAEDSTEGQRTMPLPNYDTLCSKHVLAGDDGDGTTEMYGPYMDLKVACLQCGIKNTVWAVKFWETYYDRSESEKNEEVLEEDNEEDPD